MRKVVLLFILFVFSLSRADAQEFHFIPRIGLNLANTYPESFADMRPGLNIGVAEEIRFSKLFARTGCLLFYARLPKRKR